MYCTVSKPQEVVKVGSKEWIIHKVRYEKGRSGGPSMYHCFTSALVSISIQQFNSMICPYIGGKCFTFLLSLYQILIFSIFFLLVQNKFDHSKNIGITNQNKNIFYDDFSIVRNQCKKWLDCGDWDSGAKSMQIQTWICNTGIYVLWKISPGG